MFQTVRRSLVSCALVFGCATVLSGCQKPPAPKPAPVTPVKTAPRPQITLPMRQPGLWETTVTEQGSEDQPQILQICIDALTDANLGILGTDLSGNRCDSKTVSRQGPNSWGLLAQCQMGAGVINEYSGSIDGDYATDYTMKLRSQTTGSKLPQMNRVTNYTVAAKRTGDCAPGQRPGDVINDGVKVNLFDMAGVKGPAAAKPGPADATPTGGDE